MTAFTRLPALGRAELTLLARNRTDLCTALLMPALLAYAVRRAVGGIEAIDPGRAGTTVDEATVTAAFGLILLLAVHQNLVGAYVARREELVLKRLRTGEAGDREILAGVALPAALIAAAQCALLVLVGVVWLDVGPVARPGLLLAGVVLGIAVCAGLAAVSSARARTVAGARLVTVPLLLASLAGSGVLVPPALLPGPVASVCELLPLSPAVALLRGGWFGGLGAYKALGLVATALAWSVLAVFAVKRWFRWEPPR
ncbi:ABC transporter permease [Streptomyces sp. I05A-00742]|uniref:ABC transporter permease n=1 Tax=Streptomyces sp. I05A-00742 TaxID=2732853 RepID=UPI00148824E3|nr:ABC transporter permease [Streptomyces sp. I05A-00742]